MTNIINLNAPVSIFISLPLTFQSCKEEETPAPIPTLVIKTKLQVPSGLSGTENSGSDYCRFLLLDKVEYTNWHERVSQK